ncbi:hypothetical protein Mlute_02327 [Meiothermus luteus]|jgi:hypothetical protein|uniref:Lipoprotein n=1 Tax=Meiothermus luteus TaxID=2026184 RepID=A0A399EH10_9DEIN|nr:hypothetical protein [Meiothermus luteus]RIH83006.1 hypothetical protein Mlute_02327 [Meiothermus luteus]RMH53731.1 MAG: hypothetical protein D6684_11655 [Deinococcota bacterium]
MKRSRYIYLLAASTLGLGACSDYQEPQGVAYASQQACVEEWGEEFCWEEEGLELDLDGKKRYGASYYYAGGKVYAYNKQKGQYQLVPAGAGIYRNPGMVPVRSTGVRTGGFGSTARGLGVGG